MQSEPAARTAGGKKEKLKKNPKPHHFLIDSTAWGREMPQNQNSHQMKLSFDFYNYRIEKKSSVHITNTVLYKNKPTEKRKKKGGGAPVPGSCRAQEGGKLFPRSFK